MKQEQFQIVAITRSLSSSQLYDGSNEAGHSETYCVTLAPQLYFGSASIFSGNISVEVTEEEMRTLRCGDMVEMTLSFKGENGGIQKAKAPPQNKKAVTASTQVKSSK